VILSWQHDQLGSGYVLGEVATGPEVDQAISLAMKDQGSTRDRVKKPTSVPFEALLYDLGSKTRTTPGPDTASPQGPKALVGRSTRRS
jgi:hypothetical protein